MKSKEPEIFDRAIRDLYLAGEPVALIAKIIGARHTYVSDRIRAMRRAGDVPRSMETPVHKRVEKTAKNARNCMRCKATFYTDQPRQEHFCKDCRRLLTEMA